MATKQDRMYQKLLKVVNDPTKKSELQDDPDVGPIVKKLSLNDLKTLKTVAHGQTVHACCRPPADE